MTTSSTSLTTLPPEILGRIGTYLDIFHHAAGSRNGRGDVSTFLSISRLFRNAAPHIQRAYLTNSVHYLHFCGSRDGVTARWRHDQFDAVHTRDNLLKWMDINDRWRDAHKPYIAERPLPSLQADIVLKPIVTDADADRLESELLDASDHLTFEGMPPQLFRGADGKQVLDEDYPFDVVIGIDGTDVTGMPYDQVKELIMKRTDKEKKIRCLHSVFWCFFLNSAIAADLGLLDVLRNCVEQIGIDVNFVGRRGLRFNNSGMHLLTRALVHPDRRLFEYLVAQKNIKLNPEVKDDLFIPFSTTSSSLSTDRGRCCTPSLPTSFWMPWIHLDPNLTPFGSSTCWTDRRSMSTRRTVMATRPFGTLSTAATSLQETTSLLSRHSSTLAPRRRALIYPSFPIDADTEERSASSSMPEADPPGMT